MDSYSVDEFASGQHEKACKSQESAEQYPRSSNPKASEGNTTSDDDQQVLSDRKQRRMLSNRESARRSRLRKQQHVDELRAHVAQLRAENNQMLTSFNLASQRYAQLTEENRNLRSEAKDLSHQLQFLHHTVLAQYSKGFRHSLESGDVAQSSVSAESGYLPSLS